MNCEQSEGGLWFPPHAVTVNCEQSEGGLWFPPLKGRAQGTQCPRDCLGLPGVTACQTTGCDDNSPLLQCFGSDSGVSLSLRGCCEQQVECS